jgi:acyl-CoA thioesterase I
VRSRPGVAAVAVVVLAVAAGLAGCTGSGHHDSPGAGGAGPPLLYTAVGASETVGVGTDEPLREAWPQVFFRTALPREATFVNLGVPGATVADALQRQVPEAENLRPDLATVWLNVNDLIAGVSPSDYERNLGELVHRLRRGGATRVLVANTPELDHLPAYLRCRDASAASPCDFGGRLPPPGVVQAAVAAYNAAIERVARREGAVVVDLHAGGLAARQAGTEGSLVAADGFHPGPAGHRAVAAAFQQAWAAISVRPAG